MCSSFPGRKGRGRRRFDWDFSFITPNGMPPSLRSISTRWRSPNRIGKYRRFFDQQSSRPMKLQGTSEHVFVVYALQAINSSKEIGQSVREAAAQVGVGEGGSVLKVPSHQLFNTWLEKVWAEITVTRKEDVRGLPTGWSARQLAAARTFPITETFGREVGPIFQSLAQIGKPVVVVVDGLDSVTDIVAQDDPTHLGEAKDCIFAGMFDAAYKLLSEPILCGMVRFKLLVPQERSDAAYRLRDVDKVKPLLRSICWAPGSLQELIRNRLVRLNVGIADRPRFDCVASSDDVVYTIHITRSRSGPSITCFEIRCSDHVKSSSISTAFFPEGTRHEDAAELIPRSYRRVTKTNRDLASFLVGELREKLPGIEDFEELDGRPNGDQPRRASCAHEIQIGRHRSKRGPDVLHAVQRGPDWSVL